LENSIFFRKIPGLQCSLMPKEAFDVHKCTQMYSLSQDKIAVEHTHSSARHCIATETHIQNHESLQSNQNVVADFDPGPYDRHLFLVHQEV
jgi:hypothetical protein